MVQDELPAAAVQPDELVTVNILDLLIVAALELAPRDQEVRDLVQRGCALLAQSTTGAAREPATVLGQRLLQRAGLRTTQPTQMRGND